MRTTNFYPVLNALLALSCLGLLGLLQACDDDEREDPADTHVSQDVEVLDAADSELAVDATDTDTGPVCVSRGPNDALPTTWMLDAQDIQVIVTRDPLGYEVRDGGGTPRLHSALGVEGEGYAAFSWTSGRISWGTTFSPGWFPFSQRFDPWRDRWVVMDASETAGGLQLTLADATGCNVERASVLFEVEPSTLRVELSLLDPTTPRAWAAAFNAGLDEAFLGFGERFNKTNQRGVDVYSWAEEGGVGQGEGIEASPSNPEPNGEAMTYYPVPFFISTNGYGFWLDSTWLNEFNLATENPNAWRVWGAGPTLAFEIYTPTTGDDRPWPYHLIDRFTETTGRPMTPPAWTFGPRRRINRSDTQGGVSEIQAMRDLDLAITALDDSVHFLPKGSHIGHEAELATWVADAAALGYRANCYYNSLFMKGPESPFATEVEQAVADGYFVHDTKGDPAEVWLISGSLVFVYMVDFANAAAITWYQAFFDLALDLGYSGWMQDFGEYVPPASVASNGMSGEEYHNLYPVLYAKAVHDKMESSPRAGDWLAFMRSGYTGASAYVPFVWSGDPAASFEDSDGLPSMVRAGVNVGISGAPHWGGDINGFHCVADGYALTDEELLVRWIQQGAMSSNMQDQDACVAAQDEGRKANIFDDLLAQDAWRRYARLHTRLFPYLYALAAEATATGAPVMRHPFLEHPDRAELADVDDAYYFGPALLVAPVVERGATSKSVLLPPGDFLFWDEERVVSGPDTVVLDAPLERLPILLRDGFLVPMLDPSIDTLAAENHPEVVGLDDVAEVYDVVGFVTLQTGTAEWASRDGAQTRAVWTGGFAAPAGFTEAADEAELSTCSACWRATALEPGLTRVRLSSAEPNVVAGGLTLEQNTSRRVRWDLYLSE